MATLTQQQLLDLFNRIISALNKLQYFHGVETNRFQIVPHPPAPGAALAQLQHAYAIRFPQAYLDLLAIADGVENFYWVYGELVGTSVLLNNKNHAADWERPSVFFFITGGDWDAVGFDTEAVDENGEMAVQEYEANCESIRWPSFNDFLIGYCERLEQWVADAEADRQGLEDD